MAQHDYVIANGTGAAVRSDLNNALAAIVSQNSGATEPATTYAFQFWADTTTGTLKLRNSANSAWIELLQLDGTLTMEDGTEALPGLSFRNDLDTGLWRPGANQLAISTNAVERVEFGASEVVFNDGGANYDFRVEGDTNANLLFVDASADAVGIGTSSPGSNLDVRFGTNPATDNGGGANALRVWTSSALAADAGGAVSFGGVANVSGDPASWAQIAGRKENATGNAYGGYLQFAVNTGAGTMNERMRLDSSGRLGIGTTPVYKLDVSGGAGDGIRYQNTTNSVGVQLGASSGSAQIGSTTSHPVEFLVGSVERARIDSSGRLLVGTSSARGTFFASTVTPQLQLEATTQQASSLSLTNSVAADGGSILVFGKQRSGAVGGNTVVNSGDELGQISFQGSDGTKHVIAAGIQAFVDGTPGANDMPGRLVFSTTADGSSTPSERLRITKEGWIQYGSATKSITTPNNPGFEILVETTGGLGLYSNNTNNNTTSVVFQNPNGRVGFIDINANSVTYSTSSDYRLKENVTPVIDGIARLQQLKPSRFNFIADSANTVDGFLAHEVQTIVPEAISGEKDAVDDDGNPIYQGIDQSKLVPLLTAALQEAIGEIESLKARVAALESA